MHPGIIAQRSPDKPAYIMAETGQAITYAELEARSNQGAQLFRSLGLERGDHIAVLLENHPLGLQICWAAQRSGIYYTMISYRLQREEAAYIVEDCEAKLFITSHSLGPLAEELGSRIANVPHRYMLDGVLPGYASWEEALDGQSPLPIADQSEGASMLYSSGTTGRPKGVLKPLPDTPFEGEERPNMLALMYGVQEDSVYLSPAPLYHAAPLTFTMGMLRTGCTCVIMEHFGEEQALALIERYRVTHSQWVPTMFIRMLKLAPEVRAKYDVSSLECAIHAAAPCPIAVKEQMIEWWGPVLQEYYAGTEGNGIVVINSQDWLTHKGSVGKPLGVEVHILDETGQEVPQGETGTIYFAGGGEFEYYKDPAKTAESRSNEGWTTLGDVGYLDEEGYLYLTDRKSYMIISGGVNIYPQETEDLLITHPKVADAAVFGVPNEDLGEEVKAVVQPLDMADAGPALAAELIEYCRERISHIKCPRSVDFDPELPRHPTGKLYKRLLRGRYWPKEGSAA